MQTAARLKTCSRFSDCAMNNFFNRYNNLTELLANVDLGMLVTAARENALQAWLVERFYYEQAHQLKSERVNELDGDELRFVLCGELGIDLMSLSEYDTRAIERAVARHRRKLLYINPDAGDPDGSIVETQTQLRDLFGKNSGSVIYLCGGEFQIPLHKHSITYIGRDNAIINIVSRQPINFDEADIILKNLTLYLQYLTPAQLTLERSENIKFVLGRRLALDAELQRRELYAFLQGRDPFESFASFERRSEEMRGIVVGEVLLDKADFDITRNIFELHPRWRIDFIKPIKKFASNKFFCVFVNAENAARMFEIESRKQLIYADFGTEGSDAAIKVLYLMTEACGKLLILSTDKPSMKSVDEFASQTSGSGDAGYGLELIAAFKSNLATEFGS